MSDTRRAFALDSRAVWVESQLTSKGSLVPKDNLYNGPGQYSVNVPERHISTPSLGGFVSSGHFKPFKSSIRTSTALSNSSDTDLESYRRSIASTKTMRLPTDPHTENRTIFHDHDIRQPLDPNRRYCATPGPYIAPSDILQSTYHDGTSKVKGLSWGDKKHDRNPTKEYGAVYDVAHDSYVIRPKPKFGSFNRLPSSASIVIRDESTLLSESGGNSPVRNTREESPPPNGRVIHRHHSQIIETKKVRAATHPELKCYPAHHPVIRLPKLKKRSTMQGVVLKNESYIPIKNKYTDITPNLVKRDARIGLFNKIYAIPRAHKSVEVYGTEMR